MKRMEDEEFGFSRRENERMRREMANKWDEMLGLIHE